MEITKKDSLFLVTMIDSYILSQIFLSNDFKEEYNYSLKLKELFNEKNKVSFDLKHHIDICHLINLLDFLYHLYRDFKKCSKYSLKDFGMYVYMNSVDTIYFEDCRSFKDEYELVIYKFLNVKEL